jgi:hypothetical protein
MANVFLGNHDIRDLAAVQNLQINTLGQATVADYLADILQQYEAQFADFRAQLLGPTTTNYIVGIDREATGMYLQRGSEYSRPDAFRVAPGRDVMRFPLYVFQRRTSWTRYYLARATVEDLLRTQRALAYQDTNTLIREGLRALLVKENFTFKDEFYGDLAITPFLNADGFIPPAWFNNTFDGTHTHYAGSNGTTNTAIDAAFLAARNHLREHGYFGNLKAWIPSNVEDTLRTCANFKPRPDPFIIVAPGSTQEYASVSDEDAIGRLHDFEVIVKPYLPNNYVFMWDAAAGPPLIERIHEVPEFRGFKLVASEGAFPLEDAIYERWVGYGVANRINGYCLQVVASTAYTSPTWTE